MNKETINKFGFHYLLGINKDGQKVWLEKESWDCDWYWGFGYLHTYRRNDFDSHFHFDSTFLKGPDHAYNMFKNYFKETVLTDNEIWEFCDYMQTFYTLQETAALFKRGYSWLTERAKLDVIKSTENYELVNKVLLPELFKKIEQLLTPTE